jgi:hypothetical protein
VPCAIGGDLYTIPARRRFAAADSTFLEGRFATTPLLAVGIDTNRKKNVMLAWAVVEGENRSSWEWLFTHLRRAIPAVADEPYVVISYRDKGLIRGVKILGEHAKAVYC